MCNLHGSVKGFGTLNHDLLIAKLRVYGFLKDALRCKKNYLQNRKGKMGRVPEWMKILVNGKDNKALPQGLTLGSQLFKVF